MKAGVKLFDHQKLELSYMDSSESFAIFADQGTGKTLPTLIHLLNLYDRNEIGQSLVLAPKRVKDSWWVAINKFFTEDEVSRFERFLTVTNYEQIIGKNGKSRHPPGEYQAIVCDEGHRLKGRTTKTSRAAVDLSYQATYRYILTGTPVSNGQLENYFSLFTFLYPTKPVRGYYGNEIFGRWSDFVLRYCKLNKWYQPYAYTNVDELQAIVEDHSFRVLKKDCLDLPDKLPDVIFKVDLAEKRLFDKMAKTSALVDYDLVAENPLAKRNYLRQISVGFLNVNEGETIQLKENKTKELDDFLEDFDKKLVIYYNFTHSFNNICKVLDKRKIKYVYLNGKQKDGQVWKKFQDDESIRVIVVQYQAGSMGIDLYAADTMLFYEPTESSNLLSQAQDRIHRIGTKQPCTYIHMLGSPLEHAIYKATSSYQDFNDRFFQEYMETYTKGSAFN